MQIKLRLFLISFFSFILFLGLLSRAQTAKQTPAQAAAARKHAADSTRQAQQHVIDSSRTARQQALDSARESRQHILDSTKTARATQMKAMQLARQHTTDSVKAYRKHVTDSLNVIRKYRDSKHFKDSVTKVRLSKANKLKAQRKAYIDSLKLARKKVTDSVLHVRKTQMEMQHFIQKRRADSLAYIRKYRESRRYRDSVTVFRRIRTEQMEKMRKKRADSLFKVRKHFSDSLVKARKHFTDSITKVRKHRLDSLASVRKARTDSLAKEKKKRETATAAAQKKKEQKLQLALDLKIKHKREAWSNEKMLKKKWSIQRQVVQNTFTRYNYYFNANRKMDEALANMQRVRRDNYDSLIGLYPFDPNKDSSLMSGDMDSIIRKVSVGIQIHDPRTKWGDDLYLLLGQAYYYKGHYDEANTAFHYIISMDERKKKKPAQSAHKAGTQPSIVEAQKKTMLDFLKHKAVHNDAVLWLSRTYTEAHQPEKAESVMALMESDSTSVKNLKGRIALANAFLALNNNDYKDASSQLMIAANDNNISDYMRMRAAFLSGQLLQRQGAYAASADNFKKVISLNPKIEMDFYARKYLAYSSMYGGGNEKEAVAALQKVLNDGKYSNYYEQVYYMLGRLAQNSNNPTDAVSYLEKGIHAGRTTKKQKAISFATLGNVYYSTGDYVAAKHAYDSAARMANAAPNDSSVMVAVVRSRALGEVAGPATVIHDQDSLLALSLMSEKEQRSVARKYIKHLEKLRADSIYRAENAGINSVTAAEPAMGEETGAVWYFANATQMQQGYTDFKRKWGNRPLEDNWRRSAALSFSGNNGGNNNADAEQENSDYDENGLPKEDLLLSFIPRTREEKDTANLLIQRGYIDLANAYVRQLEDYPPAIKTLDTMEKRYPNNAHMPEDYYLRYIIALRQNKLDDAKTYSDKLLQDYPTSEYAKLVRPTEDGGGVQVVDGMTVANYYDETYGLLMQHQYNDVILHVKHADQVYKDSIYRDRFHLMEAISLAYLGNFGEADTLLTEFIKLHPSDSLRSWADAVMTYISKNRPAPALAAAPANNAAANNVAAMSKALTNGAPPPAANGTNPATPPNGAPPPAAMPNGAAAMPVKEKSFTYDPKEQHYFVIAIPGLESRAMGLKAALNDFATFKFNSLNLSVNMDLLNQKEVAVVAKSFQNATQAKIFLNAVKSTPDIFREYKSGEYKLFIISASNYTKIFADHTMVPYETFYKANYK
ncbi:MAG: hypothetical protein ACTHJ0_10285 [Flavipsychrobacter sp.]